MGQTLGSALIVEDNVLLNKLLGEMVRDLGFSVITAMSLADARRAMDATAFDILVTDLHLHQEPAGLTLAREALCRSGGMRIVLTSGHPAPDGIGGGIGFLPKPFTVAQLLEAMEAPARLS